MLHQVIENTNRDLYLAWPTTDDRGKVTIYYSPIIALRVVEIETNEGPYVESFPISINHAVQEL